MRWRRRVGPARARPPKRPAPPAGRAGGRLTRRRVLLLVAAAGLVILLLVVLWPEPVEVDVGRVTRGPLSITVDDEGYTRVERLYVVAAPIAGRLLRVGLDEGDAVAPGEVIARIEPTPLDVRERGQAVAQLDAARAAVEEAAAAVEQAREAREQALRDLARAERLAAAGATAVQDLEEARLTAETRAAELEAAQARLEVARADAAAARAALAGARDGAAPGEITAVRAPVAGRVLRLIERGPRVVAAGTEILELGNPADLEIVVEVLSTDAVDVDAGDPMLVYDWGGGRTLRARVRRVEPAAFEVVSALGVEEQRVNVIGEFLERPDALGHEYHIEASIIVWQAANVLKVPTSALFRIGEDWAAYVIDDGRARARRVAIGRRGELEAQVLGGVVEGEPVILYPSNELEEGTRVEPRD